MTLRVSTKGCYGLRAMVDLARRHGAGPVPVAEIADHLVVSPKYLHALMAALKAAGLVHSRPGCHGGYTLAREPAMIPALDVLHALEGPTHLRDCVLDAAVCFRSSDCVTRSLWTELGTLIEARLAEVTLQDLIRREPPAATRKPRARRSTAR
jgi:Rrf2 family transcriptional regulator, cysteine metabolism repressor